MAEPSTTGSATNRRNNTRNSFSHALIARIDIPLDRHRIDIPDAVTVVHVRDTVTIDDRVPLVVGLVGDPALGLSAHVVCIDVPVTVAVVIVNDRVPVYIGARLQAVRSGLEGLARGNIVNIDMIPAVNVRVVHDIAAGDPRMVVVALPGGYLLRHDRSLGQVQQVDIAALPVHDGVDQLVAIYAYVEWPG